MAGGVARASPLLPPSGETEPPVGASPSGRSLRLVLLERNLGRLGIGELERTASVLTPDELRSWFAADPAILEAGVLRTCQRVVLLALLREPSGASGLEDRAREVGVWTVANDAEAVRRLFRIAAGLDSRAPGEREIRDQVRRTASLVLSRHSRPVLRTLLREAARAPEELRIEGLPSVADLAVRWLRERLDARSPVLVIGAGTVGRRVAEGLAATHSVRLLFRTRPPDAAWARRHAIELRPSADLAHLLPGATAVVAAAKTTGRLLDARDLPAAPPAGTRYFVDLGLPRNIDPDVGALPGTVLVDLGGLPVEPVPPARLAALRARIDALAEDGVAALARAEAERAAAGLWRRAEAIREREWEGALRHAGPLSPEARFAFEKFSERLVRLLLTGPVRGSAGPPASSSGPRSTPEPSAGP